MQSASVRSPQPAPSNAGSPRAVRICDAVITWTLLVLAAVVPLFFLPWTIEVSEVNKQLLVFVGAGIAGLTWIGKMLAQRKFEYRRSVVNVIVLLYLAAHLVSTLMSTSRYMSLVGDFGQELNGFFTTLAFVVLYFVTVNHVRTIDQLKGVLKAIMFGGFFVALIGLLQGLGVFLFPFAFAASGAFNTVGAVAAMGMYLAFLVTIASGFLLAEHGSTPSRSKFAMLGKIGVVVTSVLALIVIAAIDFWPVSLALLVSSALLIAFSFMHAGRLRGLSGVMLPIASLIVAVMLIFFRFPVSFQYPSEVMPSTKASIGIAMQTLHESPLFGSGPGTFIFDYAKHRSAEVNLTRFWNVRFDRGSSSFVTMLATHGLLGTLSWIMLILFLFVSAVRRLFKADEETWHVLIGMFSAWVLLVVARFVYSSTMTLDFLFWMTMAMLVIVHRRDFFTLRFERSPRAAMTVSFVFILALVFTASGLFVEGQRYAGELAYAKAIRGDQSGADIDGVLGDLNRAASLNQSNDVYLRNLALGMLVKADKLFSTPPDVQQGDDESDEDFASRKQSEAQDRLRQASQMTANAVNVAKHATDINPDNVANWSVLASVYRSLIGVTDGADEWARSSFEKAVDLEPNNPGLRTELGKVIVYQADVAAKDLQTDDKDKKAAAQDKVDKLLGEASDAFNAAIKEKGDYAPAHYQLALVLDRQGKTKEAITKMEQLAAANPKDTGLGFQLALLYFRDERKDDAVKLLESVVKIQPDFSNARWYLAAMYEDRGDIDAAIAQLEEVAKLNEGNQVVEKKLAELRATKEAPPATVEGELPPPVEGPQVQNPNEPGIQQ